MWLNYAIGFGGVLLIGIGANIAIWWFGKREDAFRREEQLRAHRS